MVSDIVGTVIGSNASKNAAKVQQQAAQQGINEQQRQYDLSRQDSMPFLVQGQKAANALGDYLGTSGNTGAQGYGEGLRTFGMSDFTEDPGYQFSLAEGQKALERSQAAKNGLLSGSALKAATLYGQGAAAQQFDDVYNRFTNNQDRIYNKLAGSAGAGQVASSQLGSLGASKANAVSGLLTDSGAARAAGIVGSANAWQTGLRAVDNKAPDTIKSIMKLFG